MTATSFPPAAAPPTESTSSPCSPWVRHGRGWLCLATFAVAPLGWFVRGSAIRRMDPERLDAGLVLILPGIEGRSFLNISMLQGLVDAGVPYALDIVDWTTGNKLLAIYHLRARQRNRAKAQELARRITDYQREYPGRPVWIIGHSGGGAMALWTIEALPESTKITGAVLLGAAISPGYHIGPVQRRVERGVWSFSSFIDFIFLGLGTTLFGALDGPHGPSAGMIGFSADAAIEEEGVPTLTQQPYSPRYLWQYNAGGHFGCVHRVFIAENVAPLLSSSTLS